MAIATTEITLPARSPFDLRATVLSHGYWQLAPWAWRDGARPVLQRAERLNDGSVHGLFIRPAPNGVVLRVTGPDADQIERLAPLAARVRRALRLDEDLRPFDRLCRTDATLRPVARAGLGHLLRGTTLFEDVVKAVAWTNTTWPSAVASIGRLGVMGSRCAARPGMRAFPEPAQIARAGSAGLRERARLGYRAAWIHALALGTTDGTWDLGALEASAARLSSSALARRLRALPGVGSGTAAWILLLLGHYDAPVIDASTLRWAASIGWPRPSPRAIAHRAARWGSWAGLALWCAQRLALDVRPASRRAPDPGRRGRRS